MLPMIRMGHLSHNGTGCFGMDHVSADRGVYHGPYLSQEEMTCYP